MIVLIVIAMSCFLLCQHLPSVEKALQRSVKMELLDGENLYMCPRFVMFFFFLLNNFVVVVAVFFFFISVHLFFVNFSLCFKFITIHYLTQKQ